MITRSSMRIATHITRALQGREMHNPHQTIFDDAIRHLIPRVATQRKLSFEDAVSGVEQAAAIADADGYSAQEAALQEASEIMMTGLMRQFGYVREHVMPFIGQVSADVLERIKDSEPLEPVVEEWGPSAAALEPAVRELLQPYGKSNVIPRLITTASEVDEGDLIQRMRTGLPVIDDAIAAAIAEQGKDVISVIFNALFRGKWDERKEGPGAELYRIVRKTEQGEYQVMAYGRLYTDLAILTYFLIDSLLEEPLAGTGLSLHEYEGVIQTMRNAFGAAAKQSLVNYDNDLKYGVLVIKSPAVVDANVLRFNGSDNTIVVHKDVYGKFIAQGGTPESVIGGCLLRERQTYIAEFIKNNEAYHRQYHHSVANRDEFSRKSAGVRICSAIIDSVTRRLADISTMDFPATFSRDKAITGIRQEVESSVRQLTEAWNTEETLNVYAVVEGLVAKFVFDFVDAKVIIELINDAFNEANSNPEKGEGAMIQYNELTLDAAIWMARVRYLARWCAANFPTTPAAVK